MGLRKYTKYFATMSHYTSAGADIINDSEGFRDLWDTGISFFPTEYDELRNNPKYDDVLKMRKNMFKRASRVTRHAKSDYEKYNFIREKAAAARDNRSFLQKAKDFILNRNVTGEESLTKEEREFLAKYSKQIPAKHAYGSLGAYTTFLWKDNGTGNPESVINGKMVGSRSAALEKTIKYLEGLSNKDVDIASTKIRVLPEDENLTAREYLDKLKKIKVTDDGILSEVTLPNGKKGVVFNDGYKMISCVDGINKSPSGKLDQDREIYKEMKSTPVYRVLVDTKDANPDLLNAGLGKYDFNEVRFENKDLDLNTRRVEIPKGYYKGGQLKKAYINDFGKIGLDKYSKNDEYTSNILKDIERKYKFLSKGHGKLKRL